MALCPSLALQAGTMTVAALQRALAAGDKVMVIDIRQTSVYSKDHIPGAINIPAALCPVKNMPPLGKVVVYDDGLGRSGNQDLQTAAAALARKPGITVDTLSGGYAAWLSAQALTTAGRGLRPEAINYITYAQLQAMDPGDVVLVDLRQPTRAVLKNSSGLTDLSREFPGLRERDCFDADGSEFGCCAAGGPDRFRGRKRRSASPPPEGQGRSPLRRPGRRRIGHCPQRPAGFGTQRPSLSGNNSEPKPALLQRTNRPMTMLSKQKIRGAARLGAGLACLLLGLRFAGAQILLTNVAAVNVTPGGFSLVAAVSRAIMATTNVAISVFSDPAGTASLAGQVGIELYPLNSGDPSAANSYQDLLSQAALRRDSMSLGLIYARVSYCAPGTTYYYRMTVTNTNGQSAVWPPSGPLPSVATAQENSFVLQSQQLLVTLNDANPPGSIITLTASNSSSVLAAVVGDGAATNQAFFNVNDLLAAAGGTNYSPVGSELFTAAVVGTSSSGPMQTYTLVLSNNFFVGQAGSVSLGALATTISVGGAVMLAGGSGSAPITLYSQGALTGLSFVLNFPTNLFTAISVQAATPALSTASLNALSSNTVQLSFTAATGMNLQGSQQIAQLNLTAASNQSSAFVALTPQAPQGTNAGAGAATVFSLQPGRAVIVGPQPLLDMQLVAGSPNLVLYGIPGQSYQIQAETNLAQSGGWSNFLSVPMSGLMQAIPNLVPAPPAAFFRAYVLNADPPILQGSLSGTNFTLLVFGLAGTNYTLQTLRNLSGTIAWLPLLNYTLTNSFQFFTNLGASSPSFYRIKKQ